LFPPKRFPRVAGNVHSVVNEGAEFKSLNEKRAGGEEDKGAEQKMPEEVDGCEKEGLRYPRLCLLPCDNATCELLDGEGSSSFPRKRFRRVAENVCSVVNKVAEFKNLIENRAGGEEDKGAEQKMPEEVDESEKEGLRYFENKVAVVGEVNDALTVNTIAIQECGVEIEGAHALFGSRRCLLSCDDATCEIPIGSLCRPCDGLGVRFLRRPDRRFPCSGSCQATQLACRMNASPHGC